MSAVGSVFFFCFLQKLSHMFGYAAGGYCRVLHPKIGCASVRTKRHIRGLIALRLGAHRHTKKACVYRPLSGGLSIFIFQIFVFCEQKGALSTHNEHKTMSNIHIKYI